jgi:hypothetical protein
MSLHGNVKGSATEHLLVREDIEDRLAKTDDSKGTGH